MRKYRFRCDIGTAMLQELAAATARFGAFNSAHEGYGVIREELDELWDAVKANDPEKACEEAVQVGAMAMRFIYDLDENAAKARAADLEPPPEDE